MQLKSKDTDFYYTIEKKERAEIKEKGSRFIASVSSCSSKEEAMKFVNQIRSEFYDATHNCFAYVIGFDGLEYRFSDDGEPSGSAGKPILYTIQKYDYKDIVLVVTRYFGGTKLGVGGLVRAYSSCAEQVLRACQRKKVYITQQVKIFCDYNDLPIVTKILNEYATKVDINYLDAIHIYAEIPLLSFEKFCNLIINSSNGRVGLQRL